MRTARPRTPSGSPSRPRRDRRWSAAATATMRPSTTPPVAAATTDPPASTAAAATTEAVDDHDRDRRSTTTAAATTTDRRRDHDAGRPDHARPDDGAAGGAVHVAGGRLLGALPGRADDADATPDPARRVGRRPRARQLPSATTCSSRTARASTRTATSSTCPVALQGAQDQAVANIGATLISSEDITLQGRPGKQFSASLTSGGETGTLLQRVLPRRPRDLPASRQRAPVSGRSPIPTWPRSSTRSRFTTG